MSVGPGWSEDPPTPDPELPHVTFQKLSDWRDDWDWSDRQAIAQRGVALRRQFDLVVLYAEPYKDIEE